MSGTTQTLFSVLQFLSPKTAAPTPGRGAYGLSGYLSGLLLVPLEEVALCLGAWALPEHKEVALLVAVTSQRLTDYVVIGVGVIPGLRKRPS